MSSRLRHGLAILLLGVFLYISGSLAPSFVRNLRLQRYMENLIRSVPIETRSPDWVRAQVVERARQLGLPVEADHVHVEGGHIQARYLVRVDLPGYTVKLHFAPSAGR